jgi:predicted transcriptional regulator
VPSALDKKLAAFLKKERGEMTFAQFSKKTGLPPSTLFRLEQCEQSITLGRLQQVMDKLKCGLTNIFSVGKRIAK